MKKVFRVIANKYFIVGAVFLVWIAYFDQNDWATLRERREEVGRVHDNIAYLKAEIKKMEAEKNALTTDANGKPNDPEELERYARERYRMRLDGEDVYVVE